jgi:glycogen debranching enzyme
VTAPDRPSEPAGPRPRRHRQPWLHDLVTAVRAPALALSGTDGQVTGDDATGVYVGDRRALSRLVVTLDGRAPVPLRGQATAAAAARFVGVARHLGNPGPDPTVLVERDRVVSPTGMRETVTVVSRARAPVSTLLAIELGSDFADIGEVKGGGHAAALPADQNGATVRWRAADGSTVVATLDPAPAAVPAAGRPEWTVVLARGQRWAVTVEVGVAAGATPPVTAPATRAVWTAPRVAAGDHRLAALVTRGIADLDGLLAADPAEPADHYLTAGAPWYLTLFGRDSLWAARMALPLSVELAAGTLRTLARRQGRRVDPDSGEEPGKILHEVRPGRGGPAGTGVYYGTVDATPLWISLLRDAWRWGLPAAEVAPLLPALEAALGWLREAALDGAGFVRYADASGRGLANQGWKDSADAIQFADGTLAAPPIALCEVQAYAYAAACHGADLLDAFGRPGADKWRAWAEELRGRFRDRFWVADPAGRYPAIALDGAGRPVDSVTSNMGHLLGSGLLDDAETAAVVSRLAAPDMDCGFGLRTMSARAAGFNPLSYHGGSVWAHDTAITVRGLAAAGTDPARDAAASLVRGLLAAAAAFDFRLPELHGGERAGTGRLPLAYPAACRPQAWSAATAVELLSAVLGLQPDVPAGRLRLRPLVPSPVGELTVRGLRVAGSALDLRLSAAGEVTVLAAPVGMELDLP